MLIPAGPSTTAVLAKIRQTAHETVAWHSVHETVTFRRFTVGKTVTTANGRFVGKYARFPATGKLFTITKNWQRFHTAAAVVVITITAAGRYKNGGFKLWRTGGFFVMGRRRWGEIR